jgi:hypothetical protein
MHLSQHYAVGLVLVCVVPSRSCVPVVVERTFGWLT